MNENILIQFSANKNLKDTCMKIYEAMGIDLNTAFRIFMERTKAVNGFPFYIDLSKNEMIREEALSAFNELREQAKDIQEMSLDEINAEINASRTEKRMRNVVLCDH